MDEAPRSAEPAARRTRSQARRRRAALVPQPPRGPARRRHEATRRDVARRGLPGPAGMEEGLLDHVLTARAVPGAEWVWDAGRGSWRVATAADDAPLDDVSGLAQHPDDGACDPVEQPGPPPFERREAQHRAAREFERWLVHDADDDERRRVRAVVAERAALHAAVQHAHRLRTHQAAVGRAQGQQLRALAAMAPLYRAAVHHPDEETGEDDGHHGPSSRSRRQREALEAAGLHDLVSEVALLLAWTEHRAGTQVRMAEHLVSCLPRTLERLEAGRLDLALVRVVAEQSLELDPQLALELDEEVFGPDGSGLGLSTAELKDVVDEVVARKDAAAVRRRSQRKVSARSVVKRSLGDGIAQLVMTGPATTVTAVYEHLDTVAGLNLAEARSAIADGRLPADGGDPCANGVDGLGGAPDGPGADAAVHDARRLPAHRFDAMAAAVLTASPAEPGARRPQVVLEVHAALSTLCGHDDQPGWLEGHGWVPGWLVRQGLAWERCRLRRILTDPFTGDLVTVDGHTYPASWLKDPGPPAPPPPPEPPGSPPPGPSSGPSSGPGAGPGDVHGRPVQQVPDTGLDDSEDPPDDGGGGAGSLGDSPGASADPDDLLVEADADSPHPCTDGACAPTNPSRCPVAPVGGGRCYTPPAALARVVRRRWSRCAHPGCRRRATACDLDHVVPFRRGGPAAGGGTTCACNLEPKCRRHHLLKHGTDTARLSCDLDDGWVRWSARWQQWRCDHGSSHWRSPLGFEHHSAPRRAALPDERYRPTPWPPRHPDEEARLGRRHPRSAAAAAPPAATRPGRTTFPDEPDF
ncbi:DUF222 domain-containing protein [Quadrisphaera sp. KR29]|uniref:DUF222 domain-containing protein n=1 Tax=Quadrisphaera sp. KR29 TaxID=3461391 RepID=UPI0040449E60